MKFIKVLALCLCASSLLLTGCNTCCKKETTAKSACGMACCADGKTTCATCPTCSAKK